MPRVFRQQYIRPIPEGAQHVTTTHKKTGKPVPAVRFKGSDGKTVTAPVVQTGKHAGKAYRAKSPTWYGRVKGKPVPLCTNKAAAERMLSEKIREADNQRAGITSPHEKHLKRLLTEHLDDFGQHLRAKGDCDRHVEQTLDYVRAALEGIHADYFADLDLGNLNEWVAQVREARDVARMQPGEDNVTLARVAELLGVKKDSVSPLLKRHRLTANGKGKARVFPRATVEALLALRPRGPGPSTVNHYLRAIRSFCRWMVRPGKRAPHNPLDGLELLPEKPDRRRLRRELTAAELPLLLAKTRESKRSYRGLTGEHRFHLYACACGSGFRASALAGLTPGHFSLDGPVPTVTLAARVDKSRKGRVQPLPADIAGLMRSFLEGKRPGELLWPGTWARDRKGGEMLRLDLEDAGIPYVVDSPDGPLHADFHALRHTYLTLGGRAGIDLRTLQELAGHETLEMTARYSHRRLHDMADGVRKLPSFLPGPPSDATATPPSNP